MARIETDPNYTNPTFSRADEATDLFKKTDVQSLAAAVSTHVHDGVRGMPLVAGSIPAGSITSAMIADGAIQAVDIAAGAVDGTHIAANSITSAHIADGSIQGSDILAGTITGTNIAAGTIGGANLVANAVGTTQIADGSVTSPKLSSAQTTITFTNTHSIQYVSGQPALMTSGHWVVGGGILYLNGGRTMSVQDAGGNYAQFSGLLGAVSAPNNGWGFNLPNANPTPNYNSGIANAWNIHSSRAFKTGIQPLADPIGIVLNDALHAVEYSYVARAADGRQTTLPPDIGFIADDWLLHVPEVVSTDQTGNPVAMDYMRVGAITFEALKIYMQQTDARLAALEAS
jgi:hypothetical protein